MGDQEPVQNEIFLPGGRRRPPSRSGASAQQRRLVEWVAQAQLGDALPEPWSMARNPLESMVRTLAELGVIERPPADADMAVIARSASADARRWLEEEENPPEAPPPTA